MDDPRRQGNLIMLDADREIVVGGDIHGNRENLNKTISYAALSANPSRCLILQEIIHGDLDETTGQDRSVELLMRAARLKLSNPAQLFFVMGNHDLAQISQTEIAKQGRGVCEYFRKGISFEFKDNAAEVLDAVCEFLASLPLAVQVDGSVMISHSLPNPKAGIPIDLDILSRPKTDADLHRPGAAYQWVWGRDQSPQQLEDYAQALGADFFVLGHQHTEEGMTQLPGRAIVILSDHARGHIMQFKGSDRPTLDTISQYVRPISTLGK